MIQKSPRVLDTCCGSRMFWFHKENPDATFVDNRRAKHILCDGRELVVSPDVVANFTSLPFPGNTFNLVVFDPPHLLRAGDKSWLKLKYGTLGGNWKDDLRKGFAECFRVLKANGTLIFKWNETQIQVSQILELTPVRPLFGNRYGKRSKSHWIVFLKEA